MGGEWRPQTRREVVNWKAVGGGTGAQHMAQRCPRIDNSAAATYANYGAGRSPELTMVARGMEGLGISVPCTLATACIAGDCNIVAGALSRVERQASGRDKVPRPTIAGKD